MFAELGLITDRTCFEKSDESIYTLQKKVEKML